MFNKVKAMLNNKKEEKNIDRKLDLLHEMYKKHEITKEEYFKILDNLA